MQSLGKPATTICLFSSPLGGAWCLGYARGEVKSPLDYRFLSPVIRRIAEDLCLRRGRFTVEVGEVVLRLYAPAEYRKADLATQILEAAREASEAYNILFIHSDGAGNPDSAYAQRVQPAADRIAKELARQQERTVGVVPVREMEAWTLVDGDALRDAFGTVLGDSDLGIPEKAREVERILDPKQVLNQVYRQVMGASRRTRGTVEGYLPAIGERVQLSRLREVPAFQRFEQDLSSALVELGYLQH